MTGKQFALIVFAVMLGTFFANVLAAGLIANQVQARIDANPITLRSLLSGL